MDRVLLVLAFTLAIALGEALPLWAAVTVAGAIALPTLLTSKDST